MRACLKVNEDEAKGEENPEVIPELSPESPAGGPEAGLPTLHQLQSLTLTSSVGAGGSEVLEARSTGLHRRPHNARSTTP